MMKETRGVFWKERRTVDSMRKNIQEDPALTAEVKGQIMDFISYLSTENLKRNTIIRYGESLRVLGRLIPERGFEQLERRDIQRIILALSEKEYASATTSGFKQRLLRFQRWLREEIGYPQEYPDARWAGRKLELGEKPIEFRGIKI